MISPSNTPDDTIEPPIRDSITGITQNQAQSPTIVSVSDIHGYLDAARSALLAVGDHPDFPPMVVSDKTGRLHWADNSYVLVFNGDLIDRGPDNDNVLALVTRLMSEAPTGHVRVTLGNHEAIMLSQAAFGFSNWYSGHLELEQRQAFLRRIVAGQVVSAYQGYNVTYAHAGSPDPYDVQSVNDSLVAAAKELLEVAGTINDETIQRQVLDTYSHVLGVGESHLKGPEAGMVWIDFEYLSASAPPQVVGHTRHDRPERKGNVYCQNVIQNNLGSDGGEAVFLELPQRLDALIRQPDGSCKRVRL